MTHAEFMDVLKTTGIPFAYHHFNEPQELPFGAWGVEKEEDFFADDEHYASFTSAFVEFYADTKDTVNENKIKSAFADNDIAYQFDYEDFIESEKMFVVRWSVQFIGG